MRVVLATYNVRSFRAGVEAAAEALGATHRPDVALLQECGPRRALASFARAMGMEAVSSHRRFSRIRNAVLFRPPWRAVAVRSMTLSTEGRTMARGFIAAHLRRSGFGLTVVSTHLGLAPRERERHARELTDFLAGVRRRLVVGADLNEGPEGAAARWIAGRLFDAASLVGEGDRPTFPSSDPTARIDYLFLTEGIRVSRLLVADGPAVMQASDHRPVLAEAELVDAGTG